MLMAKQVLLACCTGQHCCPPPKNTFTRMYDASHASEVTKCQLGRRGIAMMGKAARQSESCPAGLRLQVPALSGDLPVFLCVNDEYAHRRFGRRNILVYR